MDDMMLATLVVNPLDVSLPSFSDFLWGLCFGWDRWSLSSMGFFFICRRCRWFWLVLLVQLIATHTNTRTTYLFSSSLLLLLRHKHSHTNTTSTFFILFKHNHFMPKFKIFSNFIDLFIKLYTGLRKPAISIVISLVELDSTKHWEELKFVCFFPFRLFMLVLPHDVFIRWFLHSFVFAIVVVRLCIFSFSSQRRTSPQKNFLSLCFQSSSMKWNFTRTLLKRLKETTWWWCWLVGRIELGFCFYAKYNDAVRTALARFSIENAISFEENCPNFLMDFFQFLTVWNLRTILLFS